MGLTKVGQGVIQSDLDLGFGDIQANTIVASAGIKGIGIHSAGHVVQDGIIETINFVGAGNTFLVDGSRVDISIAGGGGSGSGGIDYDVDTLNKILFLHSARFTTDATISAPQKFGEVFTHQDVTVDIEPGVTVSIDDECLLLIKDKDEFDIDFFGNPAQQSNIYRKTDFDDNIRTSFNLPMSLESAFVGYGKMPVELQDELTYDVEPNVTVDINDGALMIL